MTAEVTQWVATWEGLGPL